jgi:hypothetical protein
VPPFPFPTSGSRNAEIDRRRTVSWPLEKHSTPQSFSQRDAAPAEFQGCAYLYLSDRLEMCSGRSGHLRVRTAARVPWLEFREGFQAHGSLQSPLSQHPAAMAHVSDLNQSSVMTPGWDRCLLLGLLEKGAHNDNDRFLVCTLNR